MAVWLSRSGPATPWPQVVRPVLDLSKRWGPRLFAVSLVPMVIAAVEFAGGDAVGTFSDAKNVADFLRARGLSHAPIVGIARSDASAVGALLDRPVVFADGTRGAYVIWGSTQVANPSLAQMQSTVDAELAQACRVVVISIAASPVPEQLVSTMRLIYETPRRPMSRDYFRVWEKSAPPSARCPAGHP